MITVTDITINRDNYKYVFIRGISNLVKEETRAIYGIFDRVKGGLEYSAPNNELFDDCLIDDINYIKSR